MMSKLLKKRRNLVDVMYKSLILLLKIDCKFMTIKTACKQCKDASFRGFCRTSRQVLIPMQCTRQDILLEAENPWFGRPGEAYQTRCDVDEFVGGKGCEQHCNSALSTKDSRI